MSDQIYCYPNSDVLINKLNIRDSEILLEAERKLTMLRISDLINKFDEENSNCQVSNSE